MKKMLVLALVLPAVLMGCSNVKRNLGLERNQPDEFAVSNRAPLTIPPNFDLMPPRPGEAGPQEPDSSATAQGLILGTNTGSSVNTNSVAEKAVLSGASAGAQKPLAKVKDKADAPSVSEKLGLSNAPSGVVLDPSEEADRLINENVKTSPVMKNAR